MLTASANAAPFELVAVYQNGDSSVSVPIDPDALLPTDGSTTKGKLVLQKVVARFSTEGFDGLTNAVFDRVTFGTKAFKTKIVAPKGVDTATLKGSDRDIVIFYWKDVETLHRVTNFSIDVHGKFSSDYLCDEETRLRRQQKSAPRPIVAKDQDKSKALQEKAAKEKGSDAGWEPGTDRRATFFRDATKAPSVQLIDESSKSEILYSFCASENTNWFAVAKAEIGDPKNGTVRNPYAETNATSAADIEALHRRRLSDLLRKNGTLKGLSSSNHPVIYGLDDKEDLISQNGEPHAKRLFLTETFAFSIMNTGKLFEIHEESKDAVHDGKTTMFDQESRVAINVDTEQDGVCPNVSDPPFAFTVQKAADSPAVQVQAQPNPKPTSLVANYREPCQFTLSMNLKDYLDSNVTLSILFKLHVDVGTTRNLVDVLLFQTSFRVAHLGTIVSLPIVSEIVTAAGSKSLSDVNATSSIPFSYALRLRGTGDTSNIAVSFPFRLGFSTRNYPDLAKQFSFFAAVSLVFSTTNTGAPTPTLGAGFTVLDTFHFSASFDSTGGILSPWRDFGK
ncbi:MAG: hypothetical protein QM831_12725 [Kofleriaceae bacterium]